MKCNFRNGNRTLNFCAITPKKYYKDERVKAGVLSVMALARIEIGWKPQGKFLLGAFDLLHFAATRIGARTIKEPISGHKRIKKA